MNALRVPYEARTSAVGYASEGSALRSIRRSHGLQPVGAPLFDISLVINQSRAHPSFVPPCAGLRRTSSARRKKFWKKEVESPRFEVGGGHVKRIAQSVT
jgi:hypothetical protein